MKNKKFPLLFLALIVGSVVGLLVWVTRAGSESDTAGPDRNLSSDRSAGQAFDNADHGGSSSTGAKFAPASSVIANPAPQQIATSPASVSPPSSVSSSGTGSVKAFSVGRTPAPQNAGRSTQGASAGSAPSSASTPTRGSTRSVADILADADLSIPGVQEQIARQLLAAEEAKRKEVLAKADQLGVPVRVAKPDGGSMELAQFEGDTPIYRETHDLNAAISSGASQIQTAPYNLDGSGVLVGVWDAGAARSTHQEFMANGVSRVVIKNPTMPDSHASHVAGTVASAGIDSQAKGMAPKVRVDSYDWNSDIAEMTAAGAATAAAAGKLPVSNHSYGLSPLSVANNQWLRGAYWDWARDADAVARALPYYLPFWAAGNAQGLFTDKSGYETIWGSSTAKNVVTIGAVNDAVSGGTRVPANGTIANFSSLGPCDDGRIKPDLVANGVGLKSITNTSDSLYFVDSGTSMASPSASGSAALLVQHYANQFPGQAMRASTLKALLIHAADDLGRSGPDYQYGWGLINVKRAADIINDHKANPASPTIIEGSVSASGAGATQTHSFQWDGSSPIRVTLCWTDPAASTQTDWDDEDNRTPRLVHDLDLAVTSPDNTKQQPWVMPFVGNWTTASITAPATRGRNKVDNVEQVLFQPTQPGEYTITVNFTGTLTSSSQAYSLIISGSSTGGGGGGGGTSSRVISLEGDLAFGQVAVNSSAQRNLLVRNTGNQALAVTSLTVPSGFTASPAGPFTVPPGGQQAVTVTFSPTAATAYGGSIVVNSDATSGVGTIAASGSGFQAGTTQNLQNDVAVINLAGSTIGHELAFKITVPPAQQTLTFSISGGSGDADIYVKRGSLPTVSDWEYRPYLTGNQETVSIPSPAAGEWFVMIRAFAPYSGLTLLAKHAGVVSATRIVRLEGTLDFGFVTLGGLAERELKIHNDGNSVMAVSSITLPAGFTADWTGGTVAAGQFRAVNVKFQPTESKIYSGTLRVVCDKTSGVDTAGLTATGVDASTPLLNDVPTISLNGSQGSGYLFYLDVPEGQPELRINTTGVSGEVDLFVRRGTPPDTGTGNDFKSTGPGLAKTITIPNPAAGRWHILLASKPGLTSSFQGVVLVASYGTGSASRIIRLTGDLAFGSVRVGETVARTLQIANDGEVPLTVQRIDVPSGFTVAPQNIVVQPRTSQNVTVSFQPQAAQSYGGNIEVVSDKTSGLATVPCSGSGAAADDTTLLSNGIPVRNLQGAFGSERHFRIPVPVGATKLTIIISGGSGDADLYVRRGARPTTFVFDASPYLPGNEEVVEIINPTEGDWFVMLQGYSAYSAVTLTATHTGGSTGGTRIISLSGSMSFGNVTVGSTLTRVLTIANGGTAPLTVSSVAFPAGFSGDWSAGTIPAGQSQTVNVTFAPTEPSAFGGVIDVVSDRTSGTGSIACSGAGTPLETRVINLSGDLDFGSVTVGSSAQRTLTIRNQGNSPLLVSGLTFPAGFSGDWTGGTIAAGALRNVIVTFTPTSAALAGGQITVQSNRTSGSDSILCSGLGLAVDLITQLQKAVEAPVTNGTQGDQRFFVINVPQGASNLTVSISGGVGDADLYARFGAKPTLEDWDFRPYLPGNEETVSIPFPQAGAWYFMVNGYEAFSDVSIFADYSVPGPPNPGENASSGSFAGQFRAMDGLVGGIAERSAAILDSCGHLSVRVTSKGDLTGFVMYGGQRISLRGRLSDDPGLSFARGDGKGVSVFLISMSLDQGTDGKTRLSGNFFGIVPSGAVTMPMEFLLDPVAYSSKSPGVLSGRSVNAAIIPYAEDGEPAPPEVGYGFLTATGGRGGTFRIAGQLADGSRFSGSSTAVSSPGGLVLPIGIVRSDITGTTLLELGVVENPTSEQFHMEGDGLWSRVAQVSSSKTLFRKAVACRVYLFGSVRSQLPKGVGLFDTNSQTFQFGAQLAAPWIIPGGDEFLTGRWPSGNKPVFNNAVAKSSIMFRNREGIFSGRVGIQSTASGPFSLANFSGVVLGQSFTLEDGREIRGVGYMLAPDGTSAPVEIW